MTHYTTNHVEIVDGLRVWTNDVERGTVDLSRSWVENGKLWFDVDTGRGKVLQSEDRVATRHPFTGERA